MWVEPQPRLMFVPSGSLWITYVLAPMASNTLLATEEALPLEQSSPTLMFLKDFVVRQFYQRVQDKNSSAGLTNMGAIRVPDDMKPYLERFDIYMGIPYSQRTNCAIVSFEDTLTVNFASCIIEADVERRFFQKLVEDGIPVTIESNREL